MMLIAIGTTVSCEDGEGAIYTLQNEVDTSGAVLRFIKEPSGIVSLISDTPFPNALDYTMEVQEGDGSFYPNFKEVRIFIAAYEDNSLATLVTDENGNDITEISLETVSAAQFVELSENHGLPMYSIYMPTQEVLDLYPEDTLPNNTFLKLRFELELEDGRVFTDTNAAGTLGGDFFISPFAFKIKFRTNN